MGFDEFGADGIFVPAEGDFTNEELEKIFEKSYNENYFLLDVTRKNFSKIKEKNFLIHIQSYLNTLENKSHCKHITHEDKLMRIYIGKQNITESGKPCLNWENVTKSVEELKVR